MIKIGLVGTGGMGRVHYANFKEIPDCAVTALCGTSEKARACRCTPPLKRWQPMWISWISARPPIPITTW